MTIPEEIRAVIDETRALEKKYRAILQKAIENYGSAAKMSDAMGMSTSYMANSVAQPNGLIALEKAARRVHKFLRQEEAA